MAAPLTQTLQCFLVGLSIAFLVNARPTFIYRDNETPQNGPFYVQLYKGTACTKISDSAARSRLEKRVTCKLLNRLLTTGICSLFDGVDGLITIFHSSIASVQGLWLHTSKEQVYKHF